MDRADLSSSSRSRICGECGRLSYARKKKDGFSDTYGGEIGRERAGVGVVDGRASSEDESGRLQTDRVVFSSDAIADRATLAAGQVDADLRTNGLEKTGGNRGRTWIWPERRWCLKRTRLVGRRRTISRHVRMKTGGRLPHAGAQALTDAADGLLQNDPGNGPEAGRRVVR
ncbi:hypothetical protein ACLOJK_038962 [Asimina triloba]